jgi:uncharacterized protein (TIGR03382 family)
MNKLWLTGLGLAATLLAAGGPAHAFKIGAHKKISFESCKAARMPSEFCRRIALESYNTDANEWGEQEVHATWTPGQTSCQAADNSARRMWQLGGDMRAALAAVRERSSDKRVGEVGRALGRALHTLQDTCAHRGVQNPQHAWWSISDVCDGTALSPDVQPDGLACGRAETDKFLRAVAQVVAGSGVTDELAERSCPQSSSDRGGDSDIVCSRFATPGPFGVCNFLETAEDWDGVDRHWNNAIVLPAFRAAFLDGLAGKRAPGPICGGNPNRLATPSAPRYDVSEGPPSCGKIHLLCLGKADDLEDYYGETPSWSEDELAGDDEAAGCAAAERGFGGLGVVILLAAALLGRRRRAR